MPFDLVQDRPVEGLKSKLPTNRQRGAPTENFVEAGDFVFNTLTAIRCRMICTAEKCVRGRQTKTINSGKSIAPNSSPGASHEQGYAWLVGRRISRWGLPEEGDIAFRGFSSFRKAFAMVARSFNVGVEQPSSTGRHRHGQSNGAFGGCGCRVGGNYAHLFARSERTTVR